MSVVNASFDNTYPAEERASDPFGGGIANHGYQCGMVWGAGFAAGSRACQLHGSGPKAEAFAIEASKRLVEAFQKHSRGKIDCTDIIQLNMKSGKGVLKFFLKGGPIRCYRMSAKYAPDAYDVLAEMEIADEDIPADLPVSCTSLLARKLGMTEEQVVMAAGLAGGVGLSGGACGALGVLVWHYALNNPDEEFSFDPSSSWVGKVTENFLKCSDYKFECEEIVGRKFESVEDHAEYLCGGGCAEMIEGLAKA